MEDIKKLTNIKLTIEYDGTKYNGWQSQKNSVAISDIVKNAIEKLTGETIKLIGASRTDSGVHAYGQVANFNTVSRIPPEKLSYAINYNLPSDIVVVDSREVPLEFHSRYSAKGKTYLYKIYNRRIPSAILRSKITHVPVFLDFHAMKDAVVFFKGTHDFEAFRASGCSAKSAIKTIQDISLSKEDDVITLEITGDGFLYNMVRIIAGTLICVGSGKIPSDNILEIIKSRNRKNAGKTAPPHGLYLKELYY